MDPKHLREICALNQTISSLSYQLSRAAERENILRKELDDAHKENERGVRNALGKQREGIAEAIRQEADSLRGLTGQGFINGLDEASNIAIDFGKERS